MPILSGSASLTRFNVPVQTSELPFDEHAFKEILPGSEIRESIGFIPFESGAEYRVGHDRFAFRVRIDKLAPDPTVLRERLQGLIATEIEMTGFDTVSSRKRKELRNLAEEELLREARPSSKIVEAVLDGNVLQIGSTANSVIGKITLLIRKLGVVAEFKTPWIDAGDEDLESDIMEIHDPGQSLHGSRFLKSILGDRELPLEPAEGYAKLQTERARVVLSGEIMRDVHEYVKDGCELLAAKLLAGEASFRLEALPFRISSLKLRKPAMGHWTERLDERLEQINEVWELLDRKYADSRKTSAPRGPVLRAVPDE